MNPCYCAMANSSPFGLNCAVSTTALKLNYAITNEPLRLKMTEYPALSIAMSMTPLGEVMI